LVDVYAYAVGSAYAAEEAKKVAVAAMEREASNAAW
jgi:hypothetical protein